MSDDSIGNPAERRINLSVDTEELTGLEQEPLKTLMTAVLIRAIEDYHSGGQARREALRYLFHGEKTAEDHLFSLVNICECLQLDLSNLRKNILSLEHKPNVRRRVG